MSSKVDFDTYAFVREAPPEPSAGLLKWQRRAREGFVRNRRLGSLGYANSADYFRVYVWEWLNVLQPMFAANERAAAEAAARAESWRAEADAAIDCMPDASEWRHADRARLRAELAALGLRVGDRVVANAGDVRGDVAGVVAEFAVRPMDRGGSLLVILRRDGNAEADATGFYAWMVRRA